jgi:hypothetical protein
LEPVGGDQQPARQARGELVEVLACRRFRQLRHADVNIAMHAPAQPLARIDAAGEACGIDAPCQARRLHEGTDARLPDTQDQWHP